MPEESSVFNEIIGIDLETDSPQLLTRMDTQLSELESHLQRFGARFGETFTGIEMQVRTLVTQLESLSRTMGSLGTAPAAAAPSMAASQARLEQMMQEQQAATYSQQVIRQRTYPGGLEAAGFGMGPGSFAAMSAEEVQAGNRQLVAMARQLETLKSQQAAAEQGGQSLNARLLETRIQTLQKDYWALSRQMGLSGESPQMTGPGTYEVERVTGMRGPSGRINYRNEEDWVSAYSQGMLPERAGPQDVFQQRIAAYSQAMQEQYPLLSRLSRQGIGDRGTGTDEAVDRLRRGMQPMGQRLASQRLGLDAEEYAQLAQTAPQLTEQFEKQAMAGLSLQQRLKLLSDDSLSAAQRQQLLSEGFDRSGRSMNEWGGNMWRQSFILFGLSMGVQSFVREIEAATGEKLPPFVQALSEGLRVASDFGLTGMMIGGLPGMAVGAAVGGTLGALTALGSLPEDIQQLNQSLQSLAKNSQVVDAMASVMGLTRDQSAWALEAAKNNERLAESYLAVAKAREQWQQYEHPNIGTLFQVGLDWAMNSRQGVADYWAKIDQNLAAQTGILNQRTFAAQTMEPYQKLNTQVTGYANAEASAQGLAQLTGWTVQYSKGVLQAASSDLVFAKQLSDDLKIMEAWAGSVAQAKDEGRAFAHEQAELAQATGRVDAAFQQAQTRLAMQQLPQLEYRRVKPGQEPLVEQVASQIATQYLSAIQGAGYDTKALTDAWNNTSIAVVQADGSVKILRGDVAALRQEALGVVNAMQQMNPNIQTVPELNPGRAGQLQQWLSQYETLLTRLGVKQEPQDYILFGQNGFMARFFTSSQAMTLALDLLREQVQKERDARKDELRGHYNIPTDFGYRPPTVWEYYHSGATDMGPVNYPWNFPQGTGANDRYYMNQVPTGEAQFFGTTFGNSVDRFGLAVDKFAGMQSRGLVQDGRWVSGHPVATTVGNFAGPTWTTRYPGQGEHGYPVSYLGPSPTTRYPGQGEHGYPASYEAAGGASRGVAAFGGVPYAGLITAAAQKYGIPWEYLAAIIQAESGFNAGSINRKSGAVGLGQVMPSDAPGYGHTFAGRPTTQQLLDPTTNVDWSAKILASALRAAGGDFGQVALGYFGRGHDAQGTSTAQAQARYNAALDSILGGKAPMQVQGVQQMGAALQAISQQDQSIAGNTTVLRSLVSPLMTMASSQMTIIGLLTHIAAKVGQPPVVRVSVTPSGTAGVSVGTGASPSTPGIPSAP